MKNNQGCKSFITTTELPNTFESKIFIQVHNRLWDISSWYILI